VAYPHGFLPQISPGCRLIIRDQIGYEPGTAALLTSPTLKPDFYFFFFFNVIYEPAAKKSASEDLEVVSVTPPGVREHS